jgi:tetratricopeptide (TPR) repeat protein
MTSTPIESILDQIEKALAARDVPGAWRQLEPLRAQLDADARVANVWLTLLRVQPSRENLLEDVQQILKRFPDDGALQLSGCDALIRAAELVGPDMPVSPDGAAERAIQVAETNLMRLSPAARSDAAVGGYWCMNHANALRLAHRHDEAENAYEAALALDPNNGDWWFNLCLLRKAQGEFERGLEAAQKAQSLLGDRRGVSWNIAICATALGRGEIAAEALRKLGFPATVLETGMPHVEGLPPVQVRLASLGSGHGYAGPELDRGVLFELVWVSPASPCHGVVQTPTFREASVDYGDLVLWDGTPVGVVEHEGKPVPRFPLLSRLRAGGERRFRFIALEQDDGDVAACARELPEPVRLFVQRAQVEMLCPRCASGDHMHKHAHGTPEPHRLVYGKLIVPAELELPKFRVQLDAYLRTHPKVQFVIPSLHEALGETKAAGKAHQLWRGLERTSEKRALA